MNNFKGVLDEYNYIAVDYFDGVSLNCSAYFLSHCHTDHMTGLLEDSFYNRLMESSHVKIYCSQITNDLLSSNSFDYRVCRLNRKLVSLPINEPTTIMMKTLNEDDHETVVVTLLSAGHCPGSVMFLFEGNSGTVLYTGDFRLTVSQLRMMEHLHSDGDSIKKIDNLYLDTTFCFPEAVEFPSRTESRDTLFSFLDPWLEGSNDTAVYVNGNSQFGYEHVFVELAKRYNMRVHVCNGKLVKYKNIPEIMESITKIPEETRIHACYYKDHYQVFNGKNGVLPCERDLPCEKQRKIRYVNLSTMWFNYHASNITSFECSENWIRILYSMHSSYREILELVRYLNPRNVRPLVIPNGTTLELLLDQLKSCRTIDELKKSFQSNVSSLESEIGYFGPLSNVFMKSRSASLDDDLNFGESLSATFEKSAETSTHCEQNIELSEIKDEDEDSCPKWTFSISPLKSCRTIQRSSEVKKKNITTVFSNSRRRNRCDSVESVSDSQETSNSCEDVEVASSTEDNKSENKCNEYANNVQKKKITIENRSVDSECNSLNDGSMDSQIETDEAEHGNSSVEDNCSTEEPFESSGDLEDGNSPKPTATKIHCNTIGDKCTSRGAVESGNDADSSDETLEPGKDADSSNGTLEPGEDEDSSNGTLEPGEDEDLADLNETDEDEKEDSSIDDDDCSSDEISVSNEDAVVENSSLYSVTKTRSSSVESKCTSELTLESNDDADITGTEKSNRQESDENDTDLEDSFVENGSCRKKANTASKTNSDTSKKNLAHNISSAISSGDSCVKLFEKYFGHFGGDADDKVSKAVPSPLSRDMDSNNETSESNEQLIETIYDSEETEYYSTDEEIEFVTTVKSRKSKLSMKSPIKIKIPKLIDLTRDSSQEIDLE